MIIRLAIVFLFVFTIGLAGCGRPEIEATEDSGFVDLSVATKQPNYPDVTMMVSGDKGGGGGAFWDGEEGDYYFSFGMVGTSNQKGDEIEVEADYESSNDLGDSYKITIKINGEVVTSRDVVYDGVAASVFTRDGWEITLEPGEPEDA